MLQKDFEKKRNKKLRLALKRRNGRYIEVGQEGMFVRHSRKGEADRACGMETIRMVSGVLVREFTGGRLAERQLYLRDHRIFGKESRHL